MELKVIHYKDYESLLLKRDEILKQANLLKIEYMNQFGEYIQLLYQIQLDCLTLKKKINYCQRKVNHGLLIFEHELNSCIEQELKSYHQNLEQLKLDIQIARHSTLISEQELKEIKKIYRRLVKKIHPDLHPELFNNSQIKEYWNRIQIAYRNNQFNELQELEVLIHSFIQDDLIQIEDIDKRMEKIQKEIDSITSKNPYLYKEILEDKVKCENKRKEYQKEIEQYILYKKELETLFYSFSIQQVIL